MKDILNLTVLVVAYFAWLTYTFPPLVAAKSATAQVIRRVCFYTVCAGFGWSIGAILAEVL